MKLFRASISFLKQNQFIWIRIQKIRSILRRMRSISFFIYDVKNSLYAMHWPVKQKCRSTLSAELVFQYHKLEKGLVMPGEKRMFGVNPARETMRLLLNWEDLEDGNISDPIYLAGIGTLQCYMDHISAKGLDKKDTITSEVQLFLQKYSFQQKKYQTPSKKLTYFNPDEFEKLSLARRSVRNFSEKPVSRDTIISCFKTAQQAPSACNRQPCSVKIISDPNLKLEILKYQNGNKGFGHLAPSIAVITSNEKYFFGAIERHQPYIDGGLFSMSFILALQSNGISSCCLNWCVTPKDDKAVHKILNIESTERIIMYLAIGYASDDIAVATSTRRSSDSALDFKC